VSTKAITKANVTAKVPSTRELVTLVKRAEQGDRKAFAGLAAAVGEQSRFWQAMGDLAKSVERSWLEAVVGENLCAQEGVRQRLRAIRDRVAGQQPTPLELLLAEQVAACWLQLQQAQGVYTRNLGKISESQLEYCERRIDAASRRYLHAIKTLAQVRRLIVPVVQVNIAEKQVNIAAGTGAESGVPLPEGRSQPRTRGVTAGPRLHLEFDQQPPPPE
jgi:hypothetical protein